MANLPPLSMTPMAHLPPVSTTPVAKKREAQEGRKGKLGERLDTVDRGQWTYTLYGKKILCNGWEHYVPYRCL